ncbi:hypothetical protein FVEG_13469 [Fusarium verticillioides 7600]|uniref:Uncharacterized protein n=1 Tax=Gibberella moniliformis (strain M3125 / FGSC 7600) TaxID=334819 RepID=W7MW29_GIBM7|nr:hypothetical protein FVEG_13469 [Fusarium verticillioides 7600]EWG55476.1 hypothetical protein FVEG_13469 [Fusarium verticillioides 7600]
MVGHGYPAKHLRRGIVDHVQKEHYINLGQISKHCQNALGQDRHLRNEISTARDLKQVTSELLETAEVRTIPIECLREAMMPRDGAPRAQEIYDVYSIIEVYGTFRCLRRAKEYNRFHTGS